MTKSSRIASVHAPRNSIQVPTTHTAVARVQSTIAKQNGGGVPKGSYVGRMQQAIAKTQK